MNPRKSVLGTLRRGPAGGVILAYLALTVLMTWPLASKVTTAIPGDGFDGWQNYWNLWWMKTALVERVQNPFYTDLLYAPTGVGLYFHTLNPFNGLVTLPLQLSGGLLLAYNAVVFLSWVVGGFGMYLLALWVLGQAAGSRQQSPLPSARLPAFLAGAIFVFSPFHMAHLLGHMQVMSLEWLPFYILYLLRGAHRGRRGLPWLRDGLLAGLFLVLVGLSDWYYVLYLFLFTALFLVGQAAWALLPGDEMETFATRARRILASVLPALVAGAVFLAALSPVLVPMMIEALRFDFMQRPASDLYWLSATVADFLIPNRLHTLFRPHSFTWPGNQIAPVSERTIGIGYTALALALAGGVMAWRRTRFWLLAAGLFLLIALGPSLHGLSITWADVPQADPGPTWTPYSLLVRTVPFMRISRSVSRFAVMVQLGVAVAAAPGLAVLLGRVASRRRQWSVFLAALGLLLAEYWVAPYPMTEPDTPAFYQELAAQLGQQAVLNVPMNWDRPGYLLYQTVHRKPLTVAYISRDDPRTLTTRVPLLQHLRHLGPDILDVDLGQVGQTVLADLGVGWVVADRYKMPGGPEREITAALVQEVFAAQPPLYRDERLTVYAVAPPARPAPYLSLGPSGWGPWQKEPAPGRGEAGSGPASRRLLGSSPAALRVHHAPPGARITIQYRTEGDVGVGLLASPGDEVPSMRLSPAPDGATVTLALADLAVPAARVEGFDQVQEIFLQALGPGSVWIERVTLQGDKLGR